MQIKIESFQAIYIYDNINLILNDSSNNEVTVEAGENIIEQIEIKNSGETLTLNNSNTCNWVRNSNIPINIYLNLPLKSKIFIYGNGTISTKKNLKIESLNIHHYSSSNLDLNIDSKYIYIATDYVGDLVLKGTSDKVECNTFKFGRVNLKNFKVKEFIINNNSEADSFIFCDSLIQGKISGKGNVYYLGNPITNTIVSDGIGRFIKL